jgi:hypothetical protein
MLRDRWLRPFLFVLLLAGVSLACNSPTDDAETEATRERPAKEVVETPKPEGPVATRLPDRTPGSPATLPIVVDPPQPTSTAVAPADTATVEIPTLAATVTPSHTPTRRPQFTRTPVATSTPDGTTTPVSTQEPGNAGPLTFTFEIYWSAHPTDPMESIATVTVYASGGGGGYEYYLGGDPVDGPVFEYPWRNCMGNPQSLTVTSADGQSVTQDYFENPPCPSPTPTP